MKAFRSIRYKLLAFVLLTTFCALVVSGGIILLYDIKAYQNRSISEMTTQVELLSYSTAPALQFVDESEARENLELLSAHPAVRAAAIYNARGNLFASYVREGEGYDLPPLPGEEGVRTEDDNLMIFKRIVENGEILGMAYIHSMYQVNERIWDFIGILSLVAVGAMMVAIAVGMWLQFLITRPILSISRIVDDVTKRQDYSRRARKYSDDEVGSLVDGFNKMLNEIENRTTALEESNRNLEQESAERKRATEEVLRLNEDLEAKVKTRTSQLQMTNEELQSFCYSVSHDLRGPLRSISGFSQALKEELPEDLPEEPARYLERIIASTHRMGQLIEDLLNLSRVSRGQLALQDVDFSQASKEVLEDLRDRDPGHNVVVSVWDGIVVRADPKLLRIVLENLLGNAWKFSSRKEQPRIEVGSMRDGKREVYFIRDNGAGFDMKYADKLFGAFQRLHAANEFPGTGIGLATVQRIVHRHNGRIWFDSSPGNGAVFYFTLSGGDENAAEPGGDPMSLETETTDLASEQP